MLFEKSKYYILRTKWDKVVKQKAVCGEGNRHCLECVRNAVTCLLHNREDKFLKKTCKYPCSFTCMVIKASAVCMEDGQKDVL
jgi:hypothetical protein